MQVVHHHHAAVLGPPQRVKLVVLALAQGQEGLPRLEELVLKVRPRLLPHLRRQGLGERGARTTGVAAELGVVWAAP